MVEYCPGLLVFESRFAGLNMLEVVVQEVGPLLVEAPLVEVVPLSIARSDLLRILVP